MTPVGNNISFEFLGASALEEVTVVAVAVAVDDDVNNSFSSSISYSDIEDISSGVKVLTRGWLTHSDWGFS